MDESKKVNLNPPSHFFLLKNFFSFPFCLLESCTSGYYSTHERMMFFESVHDLNVFEDLFNSKATFHIYTQNSCFRKKHYSCCYCHQAVHLDPLHTKPQPLQHAGITRHHTLPFL